jgi:hypothetical protein
MRGGSSLQERHTTACPTLQHLVLFPVYLCVSRVWPRKNYSPPSVFEWDMLFKMHAYLEILQCDGQFAIESDVTSGDVYLSYLGCLLPSVFSNILYSNPR